MSDQWQMPDGWTTEAQGIADQYMIYPPPGYGPRFKVSWHEADSQEGLRKVIRSKVEERIREIEAKRRTEKQEWTESRQRLEEIAKRHALDVTEPDGVFARAILAIMNRLDDR